MEKSEMLLRVKGLCLLVFKSHFFFMLAYILKIPMDNIHCDNSIFF